MCCSSREFRNRELRYPRQYKFSENRKGLRGWGSTDRYDAMGQLVTDWTTNSCFWRARISRLERQMRLLYLKQVLESLGSREVWGSSTHAIELLSFVQCEGLDYKDSMGLCHSFK